MEITWEIDRDRRLVRMRYTGEPDYATWAGVMERIFRHPDYQPGHGFVADLAESAVPDAAHLQSVRDFFAAHRAEMAGGRWANVVDRPGHYGMTRMAQVLAEGLPARLEVFSSVTEAEAWARGGPGPRGS